MVCDRAMVSGGKGNNGIGTFFDILGNWLSHKCLWIVISVFGWWAYILRHKLAIKSLYSVRRKSLAQSRSYILGVVLSIIILGSPFNLVANADNSEEPKSEPNFEGSVMHTNDLIQTEVGEAFSEVFCFPKTGCFDGVAAVDQLFLLDVGIRGDELASRTKRLGNLAASDKIETPSFFLVNTAGVQRSQAIYKDSSDVVRINQIAQTVSGSKSITYILQATNIGTSTINNFKIGVYTDWDVDTSTGDTAQYNSSTDTVSQCETTCVGISSPIPSSARHIAVAELADTADKVLSAPNNVTGPITGDMAISLAWNLGSLGPGQTRSVPVILAVGSSLTDLNTEVVNAKSSFGKITIFKKDPLGNLVTELGASFQITPNPLTSSGSLTIVDNGLNDDDATIGKIKINAFFGTYSITETQAPARYLLPSNPTQTNLVLDSSTPNLDKTVNFVDPLSTTPPTTTVMGGIEVTTTTSPLIQQVSAGQTITVNVPPTPTTASVTKINIPSNSACTNASLNISQRSVLFSGESAPPNVLIEILQVNVNNCSDFTTEAGLNGAITIFVLIKKNLDVDKLPDGCPDAEFRIFNTNTGVYDPLTLTRHPETDIKGDPSTDADDLCEYIGEAPHLSKFSVGGIKKATGGGGSRDVDWTTVDRIEPSIVEYYWKPDVPSAGQNVTVNAHLLDDVGVDKATLYYNTPKDNYSKAYSISMSKLNVEWFTADVPGSDVGTPNIGFWITVIDFGGNMAKSDAKEVKVQQGTSVSIKASANNLPAHVLETIKPRFTPYIEKLEIISMNGGKEIKSYPDKIIIRNAGNIAVNNIRIMLSPEISNSFKLSDKAIKSIEPNGNVTINMELNGNPNRDMFGGLAGYKGEVMVMAEHHNPVTLPVKIGAQESNYMSDYLDKVASMTKRYNRLSLLNNLLPHASAENKDFDLTTSSGDREITSASDSLTINNTSDKQINNVRIIVSKLGDMFLLDKSNIKTIAPNESVTIKLVPKIDSTKYSPKDFKGEIIVIGDNGLPNVIPVRINGTEQKDSKDEFEVRTMSENNTITEAVDRITIKNNGNRTLDSVKLIISAGPDRTLGLSENSFRTIEPNSEVTVDLRFKAAIGEKKQEFMQNYVGELTVVSEHHNLNKVPISIKWNKIEGKHFTVYARSGNEPVAKQVIDVLENNYQNITSRFGEMKTKTVIYMAGSEEEMRVVNPSMHPYYSYTDDAIFICACGGNADAKHNAVKEFIYRLVINNYASYHNMKKFIFDHENWLLDGVTSYMASNIVSTAITNESHAAFTSDTSFQWYSYGSAEQYGVTYSFFEYLEGKYGSKVIDKTLYYLGTGMVSNHRCDTIESCAVLQAVYDASGLDMNIKKYTLSFNTLIDGWKGYVEQNYSNDDTIMTKSIHR